MELLFLVLSFLLILTPGLASFYSSNLLIYSVGVMGKHSDLRKMGKSSLVYWLGASVAALAIVLPAWIVATSLAKDNGGQWVVLIIFSAAALGAHATYSLAHYLYKTHLGTPPKSKKNFTQKKLVKISKSHGLIKRDFIFGFANSAFSYLSNLPIIIGAAVTLILTDYSGSDYFTVLLLLISSPILTLYFLMYFGVNLGGIERFRKKYSTRALLFTGTLSWMLALAIILLAIS